MIFSDSYQLNRVLLFEKENPNLFILLPHLIVLKTYALYYIINDFITLAKINFI